MRVLQVCPDFPPWAGSGASETFRLLAQSWHRSGHSVTVACSLPGSRAALPPIDAPYRIDSYRLADLPRRLHEATYYAPMVAEDRRRFRGFIRRESAGYDLIVVHGLLETVPRQFLMHCPSDDFQRLVSLQYGVSAADYSRVLSAGSWLAHKSLGNLLLSRTETVGVFSNESNLELREYFGVLKRKKVLQLALGIDTDSFAKERDSVARELPAADQWLASRSIRTPFIFAIGRNNRAKGFDLLLEGFSPLAKEFPTLTLVLAGERTPFTRDLEHMVYAHGLERRVLILGRISSWERMVLLTSCTVFAIPSRKEGYGLNAVQARILSKPTVATSTGAHAQILGDTGPFRLVAPGDVSGLTNALRATLLQGVAIGPIDPVQQRRFDISPLADQLTQLVQSPSHT